MVAPPDKVVVVAAPSTTDSHISFIIPVLNDLEALKRLLPAVQEYRNQGHELLIIDGGSTDGSVTFARSLADRILMTGTGRGRQMNLGAENASHNILFFLHADSQLPPDAGNLILNALSDPDKFWGRFDVCLDEPGVGYTLIAFMMNLRSRWSGVATGDQGIFVRKQYFQKAGRYADIPLMEDIALSKALRKIAWPVCLPEKIVTSARRWRNQGMLKTVLLMWWLRLAYVAGVKPAILAKWYYPEEKTNAGRRGLVLFARSPELGQVKTRLEPALGQELTLQLYQRLLQKQMRMVETFSDSEKEMWVDGDLRHADFRCFSGQVMAQQGKDIGERMNHAMQPLLEHSASVVLIGCDCPDLGAGHIESAFKYLEEGADVVLGPATDGGYVLIGLKQANAQIFQGIDWGTGQVLAQTRLQIQAQGLTWKELEPVQDIDEPEDLASLGEEFRALLPSQKL